MLGNNILNQHNAKKRFGQNFLIDANIVSGIINVLDIKSCDYVLEIGPGLGILTQHIVTLCKNLFVVEIDKDLIPKLQKKYNAKANFKLFNQDILEFSIQKNIINNLPSDKELRVVGNLPYNISTPIIFKLLGDLVNISDINIMLQEEVANRLVARPGNKNYGRLSIMTQYYCSIKKLVTVDANSFFPKPKVQSCFVSMVPHKKLPVVVDEFTTFANIIKVAFSKRRKTITNALSNLISKEKLEGLNINPSFRPEDLTIADFANISNSLSKTDQE